MNGHASPVDIPVTEPTLVPEAVKMVLGAISPSGAPAEVPQARSIAGVYVEASGQVQSIYAAMKQGLLPSGLGVTLLEAQAATGGLVNHTQGQLLPVSEALQQGLVGLELKEKLLAAERAVTGYPDPYGGGKLALFQAMGKEVVDPALGRSWLEAQLATGGLVDPTRGERVTPALACQQGLLDQETWLSLSEHKPGTGTPVFLDPNTLERLPYRKLLGRCVQDPTTGLPLLPLKTTFCTLSGAVSLEELLQAGVLDEETARGLREGSLAVSDVSARPEVQRSLRGTGSVAGAVLLPAGHKKSFCQAAAEHLLPMGTAVPLLEAQAATYTLVDPATGQQLGVDEAVRAGLVGPELHGRLLEAEQAVTGYHDPFTGTRIPLCQAMKKGLVEQSLALRLLEAQLATGGLICPVRRLRLSPEAALRLGCLDRETQQQLSRAAGFSDPSTGSSLSYAQLQARCVTDPETGLAFLPLSGGGLGEEPWGAPFIEHSTRQALSEATTTVSVGKFQGRPTSLWELLFSEAVPAGQRATLAQQHREGALSLQELAAVLRTTMEQAVATAKVTFAGLRATVTPGELLEAEIIGRDVYEQLLRGQATAQDVGRLDSVHRYLQGTGCVAGLLLPDTQEPVSIYQARGKGLLRPGTALILLEAQAATGFLIDPRENRRLSVEEALRAGIIGPDVFAKLLSAERAVTGYTDPYTGEQISLFQAMQKGLIVRDHGLRLLEAQIATGGIIDPVHSHRLPVDVAYQRGYFDEDMSRVLADPGDDTKGFFDPNTHENLTYLQLLERCVQDPDTGLRLLPLSSTRPQLVDGATRRALQGLLLLVRHGRFQGLRVSAWELLNSEYFREDTRRQLLRGFCRGQVSLEQVAQLLETEMGRWADIRLPALRGQVTAHQLLEAGVIDQELLDQVLAGAVSPEALLRLDAVRRALRGSGAVGGVLLPSSCQQLSIYQAMKQKLLGPGVALALLEAQAATGAVVDPRSGETLSVDEAVRQELVGPELYGRLRRAEGALTGFRDPFSGGPVSLFQAMKKGLVPVKQAARLLEAQVATGGVIDPTGHYHLPMSVAAQRGFIDQEMESALCRTTETFPTPDGRALTSYARLLQQCVRDEATGLHLLPLPEGAPTVPTDQQVQEALQATQGAEDGSSLWELLGSCHFTEEQREAFLEDFRAGRTNVPQLREAVCAQLQVAELQAQAHVTLPGPRGEVPAVWLLDAGIITQETLEALAQGRLSPTEATEQPAVKACLWGTGCVAGVRLQPSGATVSISQAVRDGLLPEGLGRRLLEAQVATGSLIDPMSNQRLSVEDAVKVGLVDGALSEQLGQVERVVAGHTDPCSRVSLSLWQAMEKGLVPRSEGLPLLQAQLATGGAIDPVYGVHLPQATACRRGLLDGPTSQALTGTDEDSKFFFDPHKRDKLTYRQLLERCVQDADTGLWLLPLPQDAALEVDEHTAVALRAMKVPVNAGRFQGHSVSLWDLLHSEYVSADRRRELATLCQSGRATALRQVVSAVSTLIEASAGRSPQPAFRGLRKQVSASDMFRAQLIDKKTLDELTQGRKTVQEVTAMDGVRRFLEGGNFIAGVLVQDTQEKMSISDALQRGILRPGTALVLLEAQAATGFLIDPVRNRKLTVEEAFAEGMFGRETYQKLLSAERAVTGYTDPYTGEQISLFQAMQKGLIVRDHGLRLLEAQIATGGIIDPVHSHRLPVDVAYQRGYFDEDMSRVLADPGDDTKGFFDPNTHENLTYLQLLERCVQDPDTGLYMLQIVKKGETYLYIDGATRQFLQSKTMDLGLGRFAGLTVSVWDLLSSPYFPEDRKGSLVQEYRAQKLRLEQLLEIITKTVEETEQRGLAVKVAGIGGEVTAAELFNAGIIDKKTLDALPMGSLGAQALCQLKHVRPYLEGSGCIAGVTVPDTREVLSIYEASKKGLIPMGFAVQLLEAQAATGFLLDPKNHQRLSLREALAAGLVGEELEERLLAAEQAARGCRDPATGDTLSLFQAMEQRLVRRDEALRLLEVQMATGGVLDPRYHHRLPLDTAYRRGCLRPESLALVADQQHMNKRFLDPSTQQRATYQELQERSRQEEGTGWLLFPVVAGGENAQDIDGATRRALEAQRVEVAVGRFRGQKPSVWELLNSEYVTEEKKLELVRAYKRDSQRTLEEVVRTVSQMIHARETQTRPLWFRGLRRQVTALELFHAGVISADTLRDLEGGGRSTADVGMAQEVRRYLEGTGSIAGVLLPPKDSAGRPEKMSIYEAMWRGILRPGTALVLLEAQAATGFLLDPVRDQRLTVEAAVARGVVGGELRDKLLSAERAVTGYTDPYTGEQISLFQAMQKGLIVRDHGLRLLEAQIATGGIIDPVHSHRLPVDVAYQRGYFDEDMSRVLADPGDDTKGFFDPNTQENLTYLQLLERCVQDPDTGLYMLQLAPAGSALHQLSQELRRALRETQLAPGGGAPPGRARSVWELLFSREVSESQRQDLLRRYGAGSLTPQEVGASLAALLAGAKTGGPSPAPPDARAALRTATMEVRVGQLRGPAVPVWDVLASGYVSGATREQLLAQFGSGALGLPALTRRLTTIIEEAELALDGRHAAPGQRGPAEGGQAPPAGPADTEHDAAARHGQEQALRAATMELSVGQFRGRPVSVWDVLSSSYLSAERRAQLLARHAAGDLGLPALVAALTLLVEEAEQRLGRLSFTGLRRQVSVSELLASRILGPDALRDLVQGAKTPREVAATDGVRRYLEGTGSIAGVLLPPKDGAGRPEKMSISDALQRGVLRPGTALVLLEAQAATGFLLDPVRNRKLTVEEAFAEGMFGRETYQKLLSAERAVTGYTDPYTGEQISLFQAMQKGLIVRDHGLRLLEAQIATGGIIDPVHSHRLPVDVAYQRGYFDEDMSRVLADPGDDTKGFFDPNTQENLTYLQLLERCVQDPDTGLYMLQLAPAGSALHQLSQELRRALRETQLAPGGGAPPGRARSVWELLFSREVSESQRQDLLRRYGAGSLTPQEVGASLAALLAGAKTGGPSPAPPDARAALRTATMEVRVGQLRGPAVPVWDVLASGYVSGATREQLLAQFGSGALGLPALTRRLTTIIEEAELALDGRHAAPGQRGPAEGGQAPPAGPADTEHDAAARHGQEQALRAATMELSVGQFRGRPVSVWDVLSSSYLSAERRAQLLARHAAGDLGLPALVAALTLLVEEAEQRLGRLSFTGLRRQVSVSELLASRILGPDALRDLVQGAKTPREVAATDGVRRYLEGTGSIAGVLLPPKDGAGRPEKMSISDALQRGVLRPGTALVLLEAQAATGFLLDPVRNRKLTVEEAFAEGVFGRETYQKLLSAERAVTGYTDPYTGEQISLFQAMQKGLIVRDHGLRLLEAQIATGGIIDPVHSHRLPVDVAYQRGYFDEDMSRVLADPGDDTKGFFDPNTQENLTYLQLLERCVQDPDTGLYMLQLAPAGSALHQLSQELRRALRETQLAPGGGAPPGRARSVWELLFSREVSESQRQDLLRRYGAGSLTPQEVGASLAALLAGAKTGGPSPAPPDARAALRTATMEVRVGQLRGPAVPVWDVLASGYVSGATREQLLAQFGSGALGLPALTRRLTTIIEEAELALDGRHAAPGQRGPAEGGQAPPAGPADTEHDAAARHGQEQALRAATMELSVGQFRGRPVSVWDVLSSSYLSAERRAQLLARHAAGDLGLPALVAALTLLVEEAEQRLGRLSFTGLRRQVSVSELLASRILGPDALRDLVQGAKTPREVAATDGVRRYLEGTGSIAGVLLPPKDGAGRPEKMSISDALQRGVLRPGTALVLLEAQAATGFLLDPVRNRKLTVEEAFAEGVFGRETYQKLLSAERAVTGYTDPYTGEQISLFQAMQKGLIVRDHGLRLLEAQIATGGIIDPVHSHRLPVDVAYQRGYFDEDMSRVLADPGDDTKGFFDPNTQENLTYLQLLERCVQDPDTGLYMLQLAPAGSALHQLSQELRRALRETQLAPGGGAPPGRARSVWELLFSREVSESQRQDLLRRYGAGSLTPQEVGASLAALLAGAKTGGPSPAPPDARAALRTATMEVRVGQLRGPAVPVWDVLASGYVSGATREQLLAQFGSGALGLPALTRRLTTIIEEAELALDGRHAAPGQRGPAEGGQAPPAGPADTEHDAAARHGQEQALRAATMELSVGQFRGRPVSVWDVLSSSYLSAERRAQLLARHAAGDLGLPALVAALTLLVEEAEQRLGRLSFTGLRRQVSVSELLASRILGPDALRDLVQGAKTPREVAATDGVRRYLEGTGSIAGVLLPPKDGAGRPEKMSISDALQRGVLRPGTALVLLEAQAATGFLLDPVRNRKLTVEEAFAEGVFGRETYQKLLSAERAVTGYTDPYTGEQISLFQAMQKGLIVRDHGLRLLEAQIATGGIIDPVHSHRLPVDVAYQRGYFDEDMSRVLADPGDDTKGFFDPNTQENLTYLQLLERCVQDPDTGLYMLQLAPAGSALHQLSQELRRALRETQLAPGGGAPPGRARSVWELLFSREVSESQRQDLLRRYGAGSLTPQEVGASLAALLAGAKTGGPSPAPPDARAALRTATMEVRVGQLRGPAVPVWDVLASGYVSGATREQLLAQFGSGALGLPALTRRLTTIIEEAELALDGRHAAPGQRGPAEGGQAPPAGPADTEHDAAARHGQEQALRAATMELSVGQFRGRPVSVWDVLSSSYLSAERRAQLLARHAAGDLGLPALVAALTLLVEEAEQRLGRLSFTGLRRQVSVSELLASRILGPDALRDLVQGAKTPREVAATDGVRRYLEGTGSIAGVLLPPKDGAGRPEKMSISDALQRGVLRPGTALVLLEAQAATGFLLDPVRNRKLTVEEAFAEGVFGRETYQKLLSAERAVTGYTDPYTGEQISLFQAMQKGLIVRDHGLRLLEAQIATGGIIDPVHSHRLPVDVAYQRGYFDEDMSRVLADPGDDTKGFFDPNTQENLTYLQLLERCVQDPDTGLYMLQLAPAGSALHQLSQELRRALRETQLAPGGGAPPGRARSVWELLFSREVSESQRQDLLRRYGAGSLTPQEVGASLAALLAGAKTGGPSPAPPDARAALRTATMEVRVGQLRGPAVPVWDVLASGYVSGATREQLLAQFGSGALGLPALTRRLTTIIEEAELALDGRHAAPGQRGPAEGGQAPPAGPADTEHDAAARHGQEQALRAATMELSVGQFRGRPVSVWDVLSSSYLSAERRAQLLARHAAGDLGLPALVAALTLLVEEAEQRLGRLSFTGLRRQVSVSELLASRILGPDALRDLVQGAKTPREVAATDGVRRYLEGTGSIAGVLLPPKDGAGRPEKMSISDALQRGVLRPGTALVLLEAQAATGFLLDPVRNRKLTVEEAFAEGVFGRETYQKLLSAERAVTGYTDPYTGEQISLFQAMQKGLIVRDHGLRLLEAQIATGGIIDPVHSHRLPVDVAYQRGYFDEDMSRVLADPGDDTKGFFDPNTQENLTYLQLLERCVQDPDTGLYMLQLAPAGSALHQLSQELRRALRETQLAPGGGAPPGRARSVWELLFSREVSESQRQDLLRRYGAGSLTPQEVGASLAALLAGAKTGGPSPAPPDARAALRTATMEVRVGQLRGPAVPVWDVLASGYVSGATREQLLAQFGSGALGLPALTRRLTTIIEEAELALDGRHAAPGQRGPAEGGQAPPAGPADTEHDAAARHGQEQALRAATMELSVGQFRGRPVSVWDVLSSSYLSAERRAQLLARHAAGDLGLPALVAALTLLVEEAEQRLGRLSFTGLRRQVSVSELLASRILGPDALRDLVQGAKTPREVAATDGVRRYLEGTGSIAGVLLPPKDGAGRPEKMSISDALQRGVLRPGTALVLLEAQAATGFLLDPVRNRKLTVEEAFAEGVFGRETYQKLLSAERAVTGYTDPYTGEQISLFQAMQKGLIVRDHGLRLLEAQIATGGIIDPVHSHRLPVDVAYQRGYFDEDMSRVLADPGDDTKGFFDPNTQENLTYLQLLERCVQDPDTGLYLLFVS